MKQLDLLTTASTIQQLPDAFENFTFGMLFNDVLQNFTQLSSVGGYNISAMLISNLTEQIHEHLERVITDNDTSASNSGENDGTTDETNGGGGHRRDSLSIVVPVTICYAIIFLAGILGNVITCTVISRNKSMHTATNYYLFNLAISDLMLLVSGMPHDTYNIWFPASYPLNQSFCIIQGLLSETSTNATVLTITSFTVERYIAICHPFRQHTMSKLSRAIKFIMAIWIVAFCLAIPQAIQYGVVTSFGGRSCTVKNVLVEHAFEVSSFLFFVGPMTLICVLYVLIGFKLRKSKLLQGVKRRGDLGNKGITGQTRVIRMLVAVAVAFFLCWAPFHAQRVMAVYGKATRTTSELFHIIYMVLTYVSGVLYFLSTCINPLLYSIMSHKFRDAFKSTLARHFGIGKEFKKNHTYSALSKCNGNGSIRLTATMLPQNRKNQLQNNDDTLSLQKVDILGSTDTTTIPSTNTPNHHNHNHHQHHQHHHHHHNNHTPPSEDEIMNCHQNNNCSRNNYHRCISVSSQSTQMTSIVSKNDETILNRIDSLNNGNGNGNNTINNKKSSTIKNGRSILLKKDEKLISSTPMSMITTPIPTNNTTTTTMNTTSTPSTFVGTIAEKLRRGTRKVFQFKTTATIAAAVSTTPLSQNNSTMHTPPRAAISNTIAKQKITKLQKDNSIDSAHTNTISNSSLQEVDAEEFDSAELAKYMGEINNEIR